MNSRTTAERAAPPAPAPINAVALLDEVRADIAPLLTENGQTFDRLRSTLMIAIQQNPDILKCSPESLRREISKCAADGLVPDSKEAVLLPYYDKEEKCLLANYQPMVYGIIKRMKELGSVFNIVCEIVCQNDTFSFNAADPDSLSHYWDVLSEEPRGTTRAAYVIFRDDQKRVMHREIMSLAELQAVRAASKAPNSPAWRNFESEMYQKAVLRRGSKYISINNDKIRTLIERQDVMFDFQQPRVAERVNPFGGPIIDGEATDPAKQLRAPDRKEEHQQTTRDQGNERPPAPMDLPALDVAPMDGGTAVEAVTALLSIALQDVPAKERQNKLKQAAAHWKAETPDYLHPLLKACIDISNWSINCDDRGLPWAADHAVFTNKVKALLGVEQLDIGKYP